VRHHDELDVCSFEHLKGLEGAPSRFGSDDHLLNLEFKGPIAGQLQRFLGVDLSSIAEMECRLGKSLLLFPSRCHTYLLGLAFLV
jgi:hypothetical protein